MKAHLFIVWLCLTVTMTLSAQTFREPYRPQIHFTPAAHWMNDPNGMVFYKGTYHLFYQYYPEASVWGPMHWAHAVSTDLMHWKHLPVALAPDSLGYIFSGSAVVDWRNTSRLGTADNPPLIALFTYHDPKAEKAGRTEVESQGLAYSNDGGYTWKKYDRNPVIANPGIRDFRDPKVIWHQPTKQWIVALASGQEIRFYGSPDCIRWHYLSSFGKNVGAHGGVWECPCLFPLKPNGSDMEKWVLIVNINPGGPAGGSATQYFVGDFDGKQFSSPQTEAQWADQGRDNYAGICWSDAPEGRQIFLGWMNNWAYAGAKPTVTWSGACTIPRELGLVKAGDRYLLTSEPVKELQAIAGRRTALRPERISGSVDLSQQFGFAASPVKLQLRFNAASGSRYGVKLSNAAGQYFTIEYDTQSRQFVIDRTHATAEVFSDNFAGTTTFVNPSAVPPTEWTLLIDVASVELFTSDGQTVATEVYYPKPAFDRIELIASGGAVSLDGGTVTALKSIYE